MNFFVLFSIRKINRQQCYDAGLHFTYPKDKKAAIRAAEVLAESHLQRSSSNSSGTLSLREHPDDVVSHHVLISVIQNVRPRPRCRPRRKNK